MNTGSVIGILAGSLLGVGSIENFYPFSFGFIIGVIVTILAEIIFAFAGMEIQNKLNQKKNKWAGNGIHKQRLRPS